jgi:aspartate/methionine/tyrosine aminotransferase
MYDGMEHYCLEGNHIVNLFSFSKAYGMMGWRVGYVSLPLSLSLSLSLSLFLSSSA